MWLIAAPFGLAMAAAWMVPLFCGVSVPKTIAIGLSFQVFILTAASCFDG